MQNTLGDFSIGTTDGFLTAQWDMKGFRNVSQIIENAPADMKADLLKIVSRAIKKVERDAKTLAPVDTGALRDSIQSVVYDSGTAFVFIDEGYGKNGEFDNAIGLIRKKMAQEFGRTDFRPMAAQSFIRTAGLANARKFHRNVRVGVNRFIKKMQGEVNG